MHALLKPTFFNNETICPHQDPSGKGYLIPPELHNDLKQRLIQSHQSTFDWQQGGAKSPIKYLDRDSVEYSLVLASQGNRVEQEMAIITLRNSLSLIDPVWGGIYQYSTNGWQSPHHCKSMANQAGCLRLFCLAYGLLGDKKFLNAALQIKDYLKAFLLAESGGFYAGQTDQVKDIDPISYFKLNDNKRRAYGIPDIDRHRYARENGWAIEALCTLYEFSGDTSSLDLAINTANWIIKHRLLADGGFRHDKRDNNGPYLADTLAMARAMLQLHRITQQQKWLIRAINAADFIAIHFKHRGGGFCSHIERQHIHSASPQIDENISLMRFANLLTFYSEMRRHRGMAKHCLRYLCRENIATAREDEVGILLAEMEYKQKPIQIVVFGNIYQKRIQSLIKAGLKFPLWYKYVGQFNHSQQSISRHSFTSKYNAVAFVEHGDYKSHEVFHPEQLKQVLLKLL